MSAMYLLDTDTCIYLIKKKPINVFEKIQTMEVDSIAISSITLAELEYGVEKSSNPVKNKMALTRFLAPVSILPFDETAARMYGIIRTDLESRGRPIGPPDMLIASQALSRKIVLVTNNVREFKRIKGLSMENWAV